MREKLQGSNNPDQIIENHNGWQCNQSPSIKYITITSNCSPAVDVPPNPSDLDDKENGLPAKPIQNGLIAKLWKDKKWGGSASLRGYVQIIK